MKIRFNSLKSRLIIALFLMVILPIIAIGWLSHSLMSEYIISEHIADVGNIAEAKHGQLIMVLVRANSRAKLFLSSLSKQCGSSPVKQNRLCVSRLINAYLAAEDAIGAHIHGAGGDSLTIGDSAVKNGESSAFQTGQLAKFAGAGPNAPVFFMPKNTTT